MLCTGVADFKVQVRRCGAAGIATERDLLAFLYRELVGRQHQVYCPAFFPVLHLPDILLYGRNKIIQVGIKRGIAIGMGNIQSMTESAGLHLYPGYVAISGCKYRQVLYTIGFDIYAAVKMPRPAFAKIACQHDRDIQRIAEITGGIVWYCLRFSRK